MRTQLSRKFRGVRAGRIKKRNWDTNEGVNDRHLRYLRRTLIDYTVEKNLCFATVNTRSIRNKTDQFLHHIVSNNYDICTITETWLLQDDVSHRTELNQCGYKFFDEPRKDRCGGGTGIIFKNELFIEKREAGVKTSFEYSEWKLVDKNIHTVIIVIYRPPYSIKHPVNTSTFFEEFAGYVSEILHSDSSVIFTGDFNIHVNNKDDLDKVAFDEFLECMNLDQHVTCATHKSGNTLDLILTRSKDTLAVSEPCSSYFISDHCFVQAYLSRPKPKCIREIKKFRKLNKIDHDNFANDVTNIVTCATHIQDINELAEYYNSQLLKVLDKHAPIVEKRTTIRKSLPWLDNNANILKRKLRKAEKILRQNDTSNNRFIYNELSRVYKKHLRVSKYHFINGAIREAGNNSGKLFNLVFSLIGRNKENPMPPHENGESLAQDFLSFFVGKIDKIRTELDKFPLYQYGDEMEAKFTGFKTLSENAVRKLLIQAKPTTCANDPIPSKLVKQHMDVLLPLITRMINNSLSNGTFAEIWKISVIRPLIKKKGIECILKNYRPVSNLSFISKLTERACLEQFMSYIEENSLLPPYQSAYRKGYSTETVLVKLANDTLWNMEKQLVTPLVCVDLSAAFDTVNHDVLLQILRNKFGVADTALSWFERYLRPRSAKVYIGQDSSDAANLSFSVPQGSICGPILYTVYASTISNYIEDYQVSILGYADDHSIYDSFNPNCSMSENAIMSNTESCLVSINEWMNLNRLKMNNEKTEFMLLGSRAQLGKCQTNSINVCGNLVQRNTVVKYLGVHTDEQLSFKTQIKEKCKIASMNLYFIRQIRNYLTFEACQQAVQSLVISHIDYANALYSELPNKTLAPLERVQRMAAKLVLKKSKYDSATEAMKQLHWLPIRYRIKFKVACLVFQCLMGTAPSYLSDLLTVQSIGRNLRSNSNNGIVLAVPATKRKTFADRSFAVGGPKIWNSLPSNIKLATNYNQFKKMLKTFYFRQSYCC